MDRVDGHGRSPSIAIAASIEGVDKTFQSKNRSVAALSGIDLSVRSGEYVVILGPSGCGKTTLIRTIAGLESPTAGRVVLQGKTVFDRGTSVDLAPDKRNVGLVFQNYALWPHMTVERNVGYPLRMRKVPRNQRPERVETVLGAVDCLQLAKRLPSELSGGQQQRIALARALVSEPGILLLDEPLSNLDALLRVSLRAELLRLHRKIGFTAIHITHDQEEALEMGDRVVLMREGRIEQIGHPAEVYARPVSPYAATFLGVRDRLDLVVGDGLEYQGGRIWGAFSGVSLVKGERLTLFARDQDVTIGRESGLMPKPGWLTLTGELTQIVLGSGGRPRYIVDVGGTLWFADNASADSLVPGERVFVTVPAERCLLYRGDELISSRESDSL
ncbi:ABC transporter ATP-binding protein [Homoserinimonas sp. A447]